MADGVFGRSRQLLLNKFFDPSTPSMRKGDDGETGKTGGNTSLAAPGALAYRLQRRTACFIQNSQQGPEIGLTLGYQTL